MTDQQPARCDTATGCRRPPGHPGDHEHVTYTPGRRQAIRHRWTTEPICGATHGPLICTRPPGHWDPDAPTAPDWHDDTATGHAWPPDPGEDDPGDPIPGNPHLATKTGDGTTGWTDLPDQPRPADLLDTIRQTTTAAADALQAAATALAHFATRHPPATHPPSPPTRTPAPPATTAPTHAATPHPPTP